MEDDPNATSGPGADNVIPFERAQSFRTAHASDSSSRDDDELLKERERHDCEMAGQVQHSQPDAGARTILRINLRRRERHGPRQDRGRHHRRLR